MKAEVLKPIQYTSKDIPIPVGQLIEVDVPIGGNKVIYETGTGKVELIIGEDIKLLSDSESNNTTSELATKDDKKVLFGFTKVQVISFSVGVVLAFGLAFMAGLKLGKKGK